MFSAYRKLQKVLINYYFNNKDIKIMQNEPSTSKSQEKPAKRLQLKVIMQKLEDDDIRDIENNPPFRRETKTQRSKQRKEQSNEIPKEETVANPTEKEILGKKGCKPKSKHTAEEEKELKYSKKRKLYGESIEDDTKPLPSKRRMLDNSASQDANQNVQTEECRENACRDDLIIRLSILRETLISTINSVILNEDN